MFYLRIYIQIHFFVDFFEWVPNYQEKGFFAYWNSLEQLHMKYTALTLGPERVEPWAFVPPPAVATLRAHGARCL